MENHTVNKNSFQKRKVASSSRRWFKVTCQKVALNYLKYFEILATVQWRRKLTFLERR